MQFRVDGRPTTGDVANAPPTVPPGGGNTRLACFGDLQELFHAPEVRDDLRGEREREGLALLDPGDLGGAHPLDPLAPGSDADDVVVETLVEMGKYGPR